MQQDEIVIRDAYDVEMLKCPWAYNAMLRQQAPVHYDKVNDIYLVNTYALVSEVMLDAERFSSQYMEKLIGKEIFPGDVNAIYATGYPLVGAHLVTDGDTHTRHRKIITKAFSRKRLGDLTPIFDRKISELLDKALTKGRIRFREELADPVPLVITQEQLRISDEDMPRARTWSKIVSSSHGGMDKTLEELKYEAHEMIAFQRYFEERLRTEMARIRETGEGERDDDLLTLLAHSILDETDPMDMGGALSFLLTLFPATHDTTTAALTACMHRLTDSPEAQRKAAENPDYLGNFVDEALRHETPVRSFWRRAVSDTTLGGVAIPAGSWLLLRTSSANRDEAVYPDPDVFDPDRRLVKPSLIFGTGIHTCAGRVFARHLIIAILKQFTARAQNFRFTSGANDFAHEPSLVTAAYIELDIEFDVRSTSQPRMLITS